MAEPRGVGALLAESGDLTVRLLSRAAAWRKRNGGTMEKALLATDAITEEALTSALSRAFGLPGVSRATLAASDTGVVASLPAPERRRLRVFPFALCGTRLQFATCDPRSPGLRKSLATATGFEVDLHVAPAPVLEDLIAMFEGKEAGVRPRPPAAPGQAASPTAGSIRDSSHRLSRFPRFDSSCRHVRTVHFALCPRCGDVT